MHRKTITILLLCLLCAPRLHAQVSTTLFFHHPFTDTNLCAGAALSVSDSIETSYSPGNVFTVQLSDALGSFANPVSIGSSYAVTAGSISCTIPASSVTGIGYRIRIVASNPADTSGTDGINMHISNLSALTLSSNAPVCEGDTVRIHATDTSTGTMFSYTGPNSINANVQDLVIPHSVNADTGMFHVTASLGVCSTTDSIYIALNPTPPTPWTTGPGNICVGMGISLYVFISPGATCYWTGPNNFTSNLQSPQIFNAQVADSGLYKVVTVLGSCASDTVLTVVAVHPYRVLSVTMTADPSPVVPGVPTKFTANIVNGGPMPGIDWKRNGIDQYLYWNSDTININPVEGDIITLDVCGSLTCFSPTCVSDSLVTTEVSSYASYPDIKVYPDPITTALFVDAPVKTICAVSFIDGKEVIAAYNFGVHDTKPLNTSILNAGMYILRLYDENGVLVKVQRFVKE